MTALEFVQLVIGSGVLAQGLGALRWATKTEARVAALEKQIGVKAA